MCRSAETRSMVDCSAGGNATSKSRLIASRSAVTFVKPSANCRPATLCQAPDSAEYKVRSCWPRSFSVHVAALVRQPPLELAPADKTSAARSIPSCRAAENDFDDRLGLSACFVTCALKSTRPCGRNSFPSLLPRRRNGAHSLTCRPAAHPGVESSIRGRTRPLSVVASPRHFTIVSSLTPRPSIFSKPQCHLFAAQPDPFTCCSG